MKKYKLTEETYSLNKHTKLFRIQALYDIPHYQVKAGDLGGFIQHEDNLSQVGNAWVMSNCHVIGKSVIKENVLVEWGAVIRDSHLSGDIRIAGAVEILDSHIEGIQVEIQDEAILDKCELRGSDITIRGKTKLQGISCICPLHQFELSEYARIENKHDNVTNFGGNRIRISGHVHLQNVWNIIGDNLVIQDDASIEKETSLQGNKIFISNSVVVKERVSLYDDVRLSECAVVYNSSPDFCSVKNIHLTGDVEVDIFQLRQTNP